MSDVPQYTPPQKLENPPEIIKAVYVTGYAAGNKKYLDYLNYLFENTEINTGLTYSAGDNEYTLSSYEIDAHNIKSIEFVFNNSLNVLTYVDYERYIELITNNTQTSRPYHFSLNPTCV
jgi:hypothetical protein